MVPLKSWVQNVQNLLLMSSFSQASSQGNSTPARRARGGVEISGSDSSEPPAIGRTQVATATKRWTGIADVCAAREPPRTDGAAGRTDEPAKSEFPVWKVNYPYVDSSYPYGPAQSKLPVWTCKKYNYYPYEKSPVSWGKDFLKDSCPFEPTQRKHYVWLTLIKRKYPQKT